MRKSFMCMSTCLINCIFMLTALSSMGAVNNPPEITDLSAAIDIQNNSVIFKYNLLDTEQDAIKVVLKVSNDGGKTYFVPVDSTNGDVGYPVTPGTKKQITWQYDPKVIDLSKSSKNVFQAKIIANDLYEINIQELVDKVNRQNLVKDMASINGIRHPSTGMALLEATKDFIEKRFISSNLQVNRQEFMVGNYKATNIIGRLSGQGQEEITYIIDAHFDTISNSPGADDNGSGVVGMLEALRVLSEYKFDRSIKFIGFDLEEFISGGFLWGSNRYVRDGILPYEKIDGVFNYEMIGYSNSNPNSQSVPPGYNLLFPESYAKFAANDFKGDFISVVANDKSTPIKDAFDSCAVKFVPELKVNSVAVAGNGWVVPDLRRSDHASFWDAGYQALLITDTANFRTIFYHTANDTQETLDFNFMANIVKATVATVAELANVIHGDVKIIDISATNTTSVNPSEKLTVTWGQIKQR
jgi:hypothetical protein